MRVEYVVHIGAGAVALVAGYVALFSPKGDALHRRTGTLFVHAMLLMSLFGAGIAAVHDVDPGVNSSAGLMTAYLVTTGWTTVRRVPGVASRTGLAMLMLVASAVVGTCTVLGVRAARDGGFDSAVPYLIFALAGAIALIGDLRVLIGGEPTGTRRLARHLWRMTWGLWLAAMSFFIGQAQVFPERWRIMPLLAAPVVVVFGALVFWLWRVRLRPLARQALRPRGTG